MKVTVAEIKNRIDEFCKKKSLSEDDIKDLYSLVEQAAKLKTGALLIKEKSFRNYLNDLLVFKFLLKKVKLNEPSNEVKDFIYVFFKCIFPAVGIENIDITVEVKDGNIHIIENTELTKNFFDTIINTEII